MEFVLASNNPKKLKEMRRILEPFGMHVINAKEIGANIPEIEETGSTFAENAEIKAQAFVRITGMPAIADDSGLMVDALNGAPGIYSARYAGEGATDGEKINKLLNELKGVNEAKRTAKFVTAICCMFPDGEKILAQGECRGKIAFKPVGTGGFGYDPIFITDSGKTFAQLTSEEKDAISHRGRALQKFTAQLETRKRRVVE